MLRQRRVNDYCLNPRGVDSFAAGGRWEVSFERDDHGQVVGFYLSSTRTRRVRFERVN
ncbi:MAG: hypothetical protein GTN78_21450 [Gemmatimonadales bacterium]|nr:hypothetical protein [Gemmatimonadales bacterium]